MNPENNHIPDKEPSVLDYLKSKLRFWDRSRKIEFKGSPPEISISEKDQTPETPAETPSTLAVPAGRGSRMGGWPWRSLIALGFALLGQRAFEPSPNRSAIPGLVFYGIGLAWLILAYIYKEWAPAPYPEPGTGSDTLRIRRVPLILGLVFSLVAFLTLGGNLFTVFNVPVWVLAVIFFVWAFWQRVEVKPGTWSRVKDFLKRDSWQFNVTLWGLLIVAVVAVVVFFRIYNLGGVPSEPFSDHAEKLLDVFDVSQGQTHIFFPRNTGREAIQMYLTLVVSWIFGTGLSYLSLKIGTVFCGLVALPYMYLLGKEFGGKRIGLLALFFAGIAYWPDVISRAGLRFPLYATFAAPTLYYLLRGLRTRSRNDFIISGLFLGFGLHGYTPFRIMPFVVVIAVGLYLLHAQSRGNRKQAVIWLSILALVSLIVFIPLARYWFDNPTTFSYRAFSRLGSVESPLPGPPLQIFISNAWNALRMFNWDDGDIWVISVTHRPALDVVAGALFLIGALLVLMRYIRQRHWQDLFLLLAVPLLQLPSTLSLAFPAENPALNRASGVMIPTFLLVAIALDGFIMAIKNKGRAEGMITTESTSANISAATPRKGWGRRTVVTWVLVLVLAGWSAAQNFDLVFNQYSTQYTQGAWNSSEMGAVIKQFGITYGSTDNAWIVPYPFWVDTRLPGVWAGIPDRDFALWPKDFNATLDVQGPKLIIVNMQDTTSIEQLTALYPSGVWSHFVSKTNMEGKDFMIFFVPPAQ